MDPITLLNLDLDVRLILYHFYQLSIALGLALPLALNREAGTTGGAGLRTFPLVAIASCAFTLLARSVFDTPEAEARVMYGIVTGIGFIGGGAIVKQSGRVGGTATAAGLWNTSAIGVSVAYGRYEVAIILAVVNFVIFKYMTYFKKENRYISKSRVDEEEERSERKK